MSWDSSQGLILDRIVVARECLESEDPYDAIDALSTFATKAREIGGLRTDELPAEVLRNSQLTLYCGQVARNGHYLFVGNSRWKKENVDTCRQALASCSLDSLADIFDALVLLVDQTGFDLETWNNNYDAIRLDRQRFAPFEALDDRFFALDESAILAARVAWIGALPNLIVVPEAEVDATIMALTTENPMRSSRLAQLARERDEARHQHRAVEASRLATNEDVKHANAVVKSLRRMFRNDPKEVLPGYWDLDEGQGWPLDGPEGEEWSLLILTAQGKAVLLRRGEVVNGPIKMPPVAAAYFAAAS